MHTSCAILKTFYTDFLKERGAVAGMDARVVVTGVDDAVLNFEAFCRNVIGKPRK